MYLWSSKTVNYLVRQGTEKYSLKCVRKGAREVALSARCLLCRTCVSEFESQTPMQKAGHSDIGLKFKCKCGVGSPSVYVLLLLVNESSCLG